MEKVCEIYLRTTLERLWQAITSPAERSRFQFGLRVTSDVVVGGRYEQTSPKEPDVLLGEGENLLVDPGEVLTTPGSLMFA